MLSLVAKHPSDASGPTRSGERPLQSLEERELVARCKANNRAAQDELYHRFRRVVAANLYRVLGDRGELEDLVQELPTFAPAWKDLAALLDDDDARLAAITRGLAADPDRETAGVLQVNRALILDRRGQRADAIAIVTALIDDPDTTLAAEQFGRMVLSQLTAPPTTT